MLETLSKPLVTLPANLSARVRMTTPGLERFLAQPRVAVLSWITTKGEVATTPLWFRCQDGLFLLHTSHPSPRTRAIQEDGHVGLVIQDTAPPYRYASVRGRDADPVRPRKRAPSRRTGRSLYCGKLTGKLDLRYGQQLADGQAHTMEKVIIEVTPAKAVAVNGTAANSAAQLLGLRALRALGL